MQRVCRFNVADFHTPPGDAETMPNPFGNFSLDLILATGNFTMLQTASYAGAAV